MLIIAFVGVAVVALLGATLFAPDAPAAATWLAVGLAIEAAVAIVGFLVTHGIWARRAIAATLVAGIIALAVTPSSPWWWAALVSAAVGLYMVLGPPLDPWTRRLSPPAPLPPQVIILPLALLAAPYVAGIAATGALASSLWTAAALVSAWAFSRAWPAGLWSARVVVPGLGLFAATTGPTVWQTIIVVVASIGTGWLAWTKEALLAVSPLEPVRAHAKPVFAAMAPEEVRRAAGIDEDGRRL